MGRGESAAARSQHRAGLSDPGRHRPFSGTTPGAWIVGSLVAEAAVGLQDTVVVPEHVVGNRARIRVLQIRIEVELDHPVLDRLRDLHRRRTASAMEDEVERGV
jgi:hypothetical protein